MGADQECFFVQLSHSDGPGHNFLAENFSSRRTKAGAARIGAASNDPTSASWGAGCTQDGATHARTHQRKLAREPEGPSSSGSGGTAACSRAEGTGARSEGAPQRPSGAT